MVCGTFKYDAVYYIMPCPFKYWIRILWVIKVLFTKFLGQVKQIKSRSLLFMGNAWMIVMPALQCSRRSYRISTAFVTLNRWTLFLFRVCCSGSGQWSNISYGISVCDLILRNCICKIAFSSGYVSFRPLHLTGDWGQTLLRDTEPCWNRNVYAAWRRRTDSLT